MKFLIILSLLALTLSCKKENLTSNNGLMPFVSKAYLYLPHEVDQSLLRRKLLHSRLSQLLNDENVEEVEANDVFEISGNHFLMEEKKREEYNQLKSSCAELIISFNDHSEIYFVPTGIDREVALKQIGISSHAGSVFSWNENTPEKLLKGNQYYLLEASVSEMKNNDVYYFFETKSLGENYQDKEFIFTPNQQVILIFYTLYLEKQLALVDREGPNVKCSRDILEAGLCNSCSYKIETVTGGLVKRAFKIEEINLSILIDGKVFSLQDLGATIVSKTHIKVVLNLKKLATYNLVRVAIFNPEIKLISKEVMGFDFSNSCTGRKIKSVLDLTPLISKSLEMEIRGRVFDF